MCTLQEGTCGKRAWEAALTAQEEAPYDWLPGSHALDPEHLAYCKSVLDSFVRDTCFRVKPLKLGGHLLQQLELLR